MYRCIKIVALFVIIMIVLNYIPIQMALKSHHKRDNALYCVTEPKIDDKGTKWLARRCDNPTLEYDISLNITGDNPNEILNDYWFDVESWHKSVRDDYSDADTLENIFIIYHKNTIDDISLPSVADAEDWDIVYPIRRAGWRRFITPESYLSIYDFNLTKIVELVKHIMKI